MNDRIKEIRIKAGLTQQEFSDRLGMPRSNIAGYEKGVRNPSSAVITAICREFGISETWLRTGEGQMHAARTRQEEIADMVNRALSGSDEFKAAVIRMICTRTEAELKALEKMLWDLVAELEKEKAGQNPAKLHVVKIAGRDGSMQELTLTDEEYKELQSKIESLPPAPDDI